MLQKPSTYFKRGSTFSYAGYATLPSTEGWTATSQLKNNAGDVIADLEVTLQSPTLPDTRWPLLLYLPASNTLSWPLGALYCDIRFQNGDTVIYSGTFVINVVLEITDVPLGAVVIGGV